jgi:hypothetical protein
MRSEHDNTFNLEMLYDCYHKHVARIVGTTSAKPFTKQAFAMVRLCLCGRRRLENSIEMQALDRMRASDIFLPATGKASKTFTPSLADSFKPLKFVPWAATVDATIEQRKDVPHPTRQWCKTWHQ